MHLPALLVAAAGCILTAQAHVALWDKGMFGLNHPYQADDPTNRNYNNNEPVNPLRKTDSRTTDKWLGHGLLDFPPKAGDFMNLPSGGAYHGEVSCNRAQTTLGDPADSTPKYQYACRPDGGQYSGVGALHVMNTYGNPVDNKWFGGSALAIAYTSDASTVKPNDFTVISVNQNSVWERQISYQIPSGMPPCPAGGCLCSWNWIHQGGHGEGYPSEIYNVMYRCQVTGATNAGNKVQKGAIPNKCDGNPAGCVKGPKVPMYLYQASGNNLPDLDTPPNYRDNWGFADGAQNDIFTPAATPAGTSDPKPTATALPTGWTALDCMVDSTDSRALPGSSTTDASNNTIQGCVASCANKGYLFAGVEYGQECWCSNTATLKAADSTECNMVCPGDIWSKCGGSSRINVFRSPNAPASGQPVPLPESSLPAGWSSLGCMVDDQSNRALNGGSTTSSSNTVQSCIAKCSSQGFAYAGVEYGKECWCGSTARLTAASSGCNVACPGDPSHVCGGSNRLNVYAAKSSTTTKATTTVATTTKATTTVATTTKTTTTVATTTKATTTVATTPKTSTAPAATTSLPAGWISRGCYVDSPSRVLTGALVSKGTLTYASCIDICTTRGFAYAGVEYGTQCLCGSSLVNPTPATSGCNMPCGGDKAAMCGGNYRINIFQNTATVKRRRAWSGEKGQPPY